MTGAPRVEAIGLLGIGEVRPGDDLPGLVVAELSRAGESLADGDVVVISSKIVSKAEGRAIPASDDATATVERETVRVVAERRTPRGVTRIVESRSGPVLAAAGVDASNVDEGTMLPLPPDPDRSAREIRDRLRTLARCEVGVVISDTAGRPWREGQVDIAVGAAGLEVLDDLRGTPDTHGRPLDVTVRAVGDEVASLADLVKGKVGGIPVAVVRGLEALVRAEEDGVAGAVRGVGAIGGVGGAAGLLRPAAADWFRLGHVEAVRAALGVPPGGEVAVPLVPSPPDGVPERFARAVAVAIASPSPFRNSSGRLPFAVAVDGLQAVITPDPAIDAAGTDITATENAATDRTTTDRAAAETLAELGALAQRLRAACWSEDLDVLLELDPRAPAGPALRATAR